MELARPLPLVGILLAITSFIAMLVLDVDLLLAIAVLVLWVGSIFLTASSPPDSPTLARAQHFNSDGMRDLVENSATPLLVTERNKLIIANRIARRLLGAHIIGQDVRVAFRQPEAIALLTRNRDGMAIVRGLVRRRDIWRINRQSIGEDLAVIELINQTAEADISRAHTDFVANASHELRTPLAAIIGYVETLREANGEIEPAMRRKFLDTILHESRRLESLVSDLMSLSRVEAEKHEEPRTRVALAALVERAARDAAGAQRVARLDLALDPALQVRGDEKQLEQLIRNLVDNALKYGHAESQVEVRLEAERGNQAQLTVADHGEGIAPENIPHLTRRFYRTDPGRSRASGGTGLGLAIVKHIVERHRGRLDIASELGKGTTVTVRIPLAADEDEELS